MRQSRLSHLRAVRARRAVVLARARRAGRAEIAALALDLRARRRVGRAVVAGRAARTEDDGRRRGVDEGKNESKDNEIMN